MDSSQIAGPRWRELPLKDFTFHTKSADLLCLVMKNEQIKKQNVYTWFKAVSQS